MSALPAVELRPFRKPPTPAQMNWSTGSDDVVPEQLELTLAEPEDEPIRSDKAILLSTENGSQLVVGGFGLFIGKKGERIVVKQGKTVHAQVPMMRLQELMVEPRG